jgi:acetyl-CoA carboxylase carboxyl transferase subunit beta
MRWWLSAETKKLAMALLGQVDASPDLLGIQRFIQTATVFLMVPLFSCDRMISIGIRLFFSHGRQTHMKTTQCERCRARDATVHVTFIASSFEIGAYHFCEACYSRAQEERTASYGKFTRSPAKSLTPPPVKNSLVKKVAGTARLRKRQIPAGLWSRCDHCAALIPEKQLKENLRVCPRCRSYFPMSARERVNLLTDSFQELDSGMMSMDVLNFISTAVYKSKFLGHRKASGQKDAVLTGIGQMGGHRIGLGILDFSFLGGSMGSVVGEKLARLIERCTLESLPVIVISASASARMHEGTFSLMQMAKTAAALTRHEQARLPYISVLTNPTIGGVLASFAGAGGIIIAEPRAMIGLTGARVIKETMHATSPSGFQTAEFLFRCGLIDEIVPRRELKNRLIGYLNFMTAGQQSGRPAVKAVSRP